MTGGMQFKTSTPTFINDPLYIIRKIHIGVHNWGTGFFEFFWTKRQADNSDQKNTIEMRIALVSHKTKIKNPLSFKFQGASGCY